MRGVGVYVIVGCMGVGCVVWVVGVCVIVGGMGVGYVVRGVCGIGM